MSRQDHNQVAHRYRPLSERCFDPGFEPVFAGRALRWHQQGDQAPVQHQLSHYRLAVYGRHNRRTGPMPSDQLGRPA